MKVFNAYAKYYDLLYKDKDYRSETDYINKFIRKFKPDSESILDLGCGTGNHDLFLAEKGFKTTGVELSSNMHSRAVKLLNEKANKKLDLMFHKGDIRRIRLRKKYDVIISLFHVINYQTTNKDLDSVFKTVKMHLKKDGLFIFDFWYGPAVLNDRPVKKTKIIEEDEFKIKRYTIPEMRVNENLAVINFKIEVNDKKSDIKNKFRETHVMRYLFLPELELFFEKHNLEKIHIEEWLTGKRISDNTWYGLAVLKNQI